MKKLCVGVFRKKDLTVEHDDDTRAVSSEVQGGYFTVKDSLNNLKVKNNVKAGLIFCIRI